MPNKIEQTIKRVAEDTFPAQADALLPQDGGLAAPVNMDKDGRNPRVVPDGSGRKYFMFGISRWLSSGADIIAE